MTRQDAAKRRRVPGGDFITAVGMIFLLQLAFISWLSDGTTATPTSTRRAPSFTLREQSWNPLLEAEDPTLFVRPRQESFSGSVWMKIDEQAFQPAGWSEPPKLLELSPGELGSAFVQFARTEAVPGFDNTLLFVPSLILPPAILTQPIPLASALRVEGALGKRRLLSRPELRPQPGHDLLTNSVVQVSVDERGRVFSAVLQDRAGIPDPHQAAADTNALAIAGQLRFEPLTATATATAGDPLSSDLAVGTVVFYWETISTNAAVTNAIP